MIRDPAISTAILLTHYGFELHGSSLSAVINQWLEAYPNKWVLAAVVEALYQGRYKASSVDRILDSWYSRGKPFPNFDYDFADFFCKKILRTMFAQTQSELAFNMNSTRPLELSGVDDPILKETTQNKMKIRAEAKSTVIKKANPAIQDAAKLVMWL